MTKYELSEEVRKFVEENIISIDQLETLLMVCREARRSWTSREVSTQLRNSPESADITLNLLVTMGICEREIGPDGRVLFRYKPKTPELGSLIASLAQSYSSYRVTIVELIYSRTKTKIISLSEAFRIKKDGGENG